MFVCKGSLSDVEYSVNFTYLNDLSKNCSGKCRFELPLICYYGILSAWMKKHLIFLTHFFMVSVDTLWKLNLLHCTSSYQITATSL